MRTGRDGYRFVGWYRESNVTVNEVAEDPAYFKPMVTAGKQVSNEPVYEASNADPANRQFEDNDLFIAHHQAQVLFHDVKGNVIDKGTGKVDPTTDETGTTTSARCPRCVRRTLLQMRPSSAGRRLRIRVREQATMHHVFGSCCDHEQRGVVQSGRSGN